MHARFRACRRLSAGVNARLSGWSAGQDCARLPAGTRLAAGDWRLCATAEQFLALVARCALVVTTWLHGLVPALGTGAPVIAAGRSRAVPGSAPRPGPWAGRRWWTPGR
ncbi:polysaccharide pyruvyl transferase family protein [Streptomyces sp. NPDC002078]